MELLLPPSPVHLAGLRQAARACLRGVASEAADDIVLALNEAAPTPSCTDQVGAAGPGGGPRQRRRDRGLVLDHGPDPPAQPPTDADADALGVRGRGLWLLGRLVDEVRLERVQLGTRVTLRRAIRPARTRAR